MAPTKYVVRVVRPVFQAAYIEVEGNSENDAAAQVMEMAEKIPEDQWTGRFNPEDYSYDLHCVRSHQTAEGHPFSVLDFPQYCLLSTDDSPVMGLGSNQPWMEWQQPFVMATYYSRWAELLIEDRVSFYAEGIDMLEDILKDWRGTDEKVVPLMPPAQRRYEIDLLEATINLAYVLKETD